MNVISIMLWIIVPLTLALMCSAFAFAIAQEAGFFSFDPSTHTQSDSLRMIFAVAVLLKLYFIGSAYKGYQDLKKEE